MNIKSNKIIAFILSMIMLLSAAFMLASCKEEEPEETLDTSTEETPSQTVEEPAVNIELKVADIKNYVVIRAEDASEIVKDAANALVSALNNKLGITVKYHDDFIIENNNEYREYETEIIIGNCNRKQCEDYYKLNTLRAKDYGYKMIDKKIMIGGGTDTATVSAINSFIERVISTCENVDESVFYNNAEDMYSNVGEYTIDELKLNDTDIWEYTIVYPKANKMLEKTMATKLAEGITEVSGYVIPVISDRTEYTSGKEIHIGATSRDTDYVAKQTLNEDEYLLGSNTDDFVVVYAKSAIGIAQGVGAFLSSVKQDDITGNTLAVTINDIIVKKYESNGLSVMSFNILTTAPDEARINRVVTTVLNYMPDMVGMQEVSPNWMTILVPRLNSIYNYVGEGRDGGNSGEYNTIFYKKDKFTVVESGTKWLSDTPDTVSKYPTSSLNRIFTYALLKVNASGKEFMYINTHFDHKSAEARANQSEALVKFAEKYTQYPIIMTGDFNCTSSENTYKNITGSGFVNSSSIAVQSSGGATFHNYGQSDKIIDFCFMSADDTYVYSYKVVMDKIDGNYPSDHYPLYIEFDFSE